MLDLLRRRLFLLSIVLVGTSSFAPIKSRPIAKTSSILLEMSSEFGRGDQVVEAIRSLCDFHEGKWSGTARSFSVLPDVAAGIVQRKTSPEYEVSVKLGLDSNQDYSITETFHWDDKISSRSLSLNECNVDVDSVDASYSLDSSLPNFPSEITGTDKLCQFVIEHCIAASDNRRARCFMLYGIDQSLQRIVVCEEERNQGKEKEPSERSEHKEAGGDQLTARDLLEMESDIDRLVGKITGNMQDGTGSGGSVSAAPEPSPLEKLGESMSSDDGSLPLLNHDVSLLEVSSGVWLGDAIIRDMPGVPESPLERGKGFGSSSPKPSNSPTNPFGTWDVGVQKIAWRWMWNFGEEIRQVVDVGKGMGAGLATSMAKSVAGSVCVNESLSRRMPKKERMVYLDWTGEMVGILSGSVSIQVPRYLNFDKAATKKSVKPFLTEFCVYQSTVSESPKVSDEVGELNLPELCCSKISRVYNYAGELKQGVSSFYTFKRFGIEEPE